MLKYIIFFFSLICFVTNINAQALDGCVFLKSDFMEVGIAPNGAFGTPNDAPAGYHPRPSPIISQLYNPVTGTFVNRSQAIGFVADYTKDGWTNGTPAFMGDYFMPGTVQEGWSIEIDGIKRNAYSNNYAANGSTGFSTGLTGTNILYNATATEEKSVWSGMSSTLAIKQTIVLKKSKSYFTVSVLLKNTGTDTLKKIYYMRTVDPDNEVSVTGSFVTKNKIAFQPPNPFNKTLVTATGAVYNAYLGLGTKACDSKCFYLSSGLTPMGSLQSTFDQTAGGFIYQDSATADVGIGIVFRLGNLAPGDSTTIAYAYILNKDDLDDAFIDIDQGFSTGGTNYPTGSVLIQPAGTVVPINIINGNNYNWTWTPAINLNTNTGEIVNATVSTGPIVYTVNGVSNGTATTTCNNRTLTITVSPYPVSPAPTVITPVKYCKNSPTLPLVAIGTGTILWYSSPTGGTGSTVAPTPSSAVAGTYTWYATQVLSGLESQRIPIQVVIHDLPTVSITPLASTICRGDSVTLNTSGSLATYTWTPVSVLSATTGTPVKVFPLTNTTVIVTAKDSNNCTATASSVITVNQLPILNQSPTNAIVCLNDSITLTASGANSYTWTPATTLNTNMGATVIAHPTINTVYTVTGIDINGCKNTKTIPVTVNSLPAPNLGPDKSICLGTTLQIQPGTFATYLWQDNSTNSTFTANAVGLYWVLVKDNFGCKGIDSFRLLAFHPLPVVNILPLVPALCLGDTINLNATGSSATYTWTPASILSTTSGSNVRAFPTINTMVTVTAKDSNNCVSLVSKNIIVKPLPVITQSPLNAVLCLKDSITLTVSGANTYNWSPNTGLNLSVGATVIAKPTTNIIYTVTGVDVNGCKSNKTIPVVVNPLPIPNLGPDKVICVGDSLQIQPGAFTSYLWQDNSTNPTYTTNAIGLYWVLVKDNLGCKAVDSFRLLAFQPLPSNFLPNDVIECKGNRVKVVGGNFSEFLWSTGETSSSIFISKFGKYYLTVKTVIGCTGSDSIELIRKDCIPFIIPNAFTPNGDGINDLFKPTITEMVTNYKFTIWTRWGANVFSTDNQQKGWDGLFNGEQQILGTYVYLIEFIDSDNVPQKFKGTLLLIR